MQCDLLSSCWVDNDIMAVYMNGKRKVIGVSAMLWFVMMGVGVGGIWLFTKQAGINPFGDSRILWALIGYIVLVQFAVAAIAILGGRAAKIIAAQTEEVAILFAGFSPKHFYFYNRPYLVMSVRGVNVVATWFYKAKRMIGTEPTGLLYVKIPHTNDIRLHATTRAEAPNGVATMAGWRCLDNGICLGPMRNASLDDAEKYVRRLAPETVAMVSDVAKFPYGVSILSNWHERMVGRAAALALANGDEHAVNDLDLQVRFSLDLGSDSVERLVGNAVAAAMLTAADINKTT